MVEKAVKQIVCKALTPLLGWCRKGRETPEPKFTEPTHPNADVLGCVIAYNDYGAYCVPHASMHRWAARAILDGRTWEPRTLEFLVSAVGDGDVVHAGTYFGDFLPRLSEACVRGSSVWAFEPNAENFRCASITRLLNKLENVELTHAGLGKSTGRALMKTRDAGGASLGGGSAIIGNTGAKAVEDAESVRIVSVDEEVPENRKVSLIQLDVEGYETEALSGALGTIRRCRPVLVLETLPHPDWLDQHILSLGYQIAEKYDANTVLVPSET